MLELLVLYLFAKRHYLVQDELLGHLADLSLLVAEILGGEDVILGAFGYQVFRAFENSCCHKAPLEA